MEQIMADGAGWRIGRLDKLARRLGGSRAPVSIRGLLCVQGWEERLWRWRRR